MGRIFLTIFQHSSDFSKSVGWTAFLFPWVTMLFGLFCSSAQCCIVKVKAQSRVFFFQFYFSPVSVQYVNLPQTRFSRRLHVVCGNIKAEFCKQMFKTQIQNHHHCTLTILISGSDRKDWTSTQSCSCVGFIQLSNTGVIK